MTGGKMIGGQTNERAARLARLRGPAARVREDKTLEEVLESRAAGLPSTQVAVLRFRRPGAPVEAPGHEQAAEPAVCDLDRLPGVGPGLVWALRRAGFARRADLVALAPENLAARLGPLGALAPTASWIAAARSAEERSAEQAGA